MYRTQTITGKLINRIYCLNWLLIRNNVRYYSEKLKGNCSPKIHEHFKRIRQTANLNLFPVELKKVITKKDHALYVADKDIADKIANIITRFHNDSVPFFEIDPGPGILSNSLISQLNTKEFLSIERSRDFTKIKTKLREPTITLKTYKMPSTYYEKTSNFILNYCTKQQWHEDIVYQMFSCLQFIDCHRLVNDVVFQSRFFSNGRADIFAIIPTYELMKLTAGPQENYWLYTYKSCMFQILFDCELLMVVPKEGFLPWRNAKRAYGGKIEYDADVLNLVRIVPKKNLFEICPPEDLPLLKFFVFQCLFKRRGFIIPKLEQWTPGIGIELITSTFNEKISVNSQPSQETEMHRNNLLNSLSVFTKNGSLTPFEICELFKFFQKSPHYKDSCFHQQCQEFYKSKNIDSNWRDENDDD